MISLIITDCGNVTLELGLSLYTSSRLWDLNFQIKRAKYTYKCKENFEPSSYSSFLFLLSSAKVLLILSLIQDCLNGRSVTVFFNLLFIHPNYWIKFALKSTQTSNYPCHCPTFSTTFFLPLDFPLSSLDAAVCRACFVSSKPLWLTHLADDFLLDNF